ncbi:uncharacterized protein LOC6604207 [Drosophila persimilis]|uniref:uncharacterized protein LOC6604207 n=1 Tax=Drosophila persimilis TaxID=7234 RepID=UPI000F093C97|nr:uncharacterized protein LOC6604207 [Drosophila persimilis]
MYKLSVFDSDLMRFIFHPFPFGRAKNEYSIWKIAYPKGNLLKHFNDLKTCNYCTPGLFPYVFWLVLLLSLVGVGCTMSQMLRLWVCRECELRMWRSREFHVFAAAILRRARMMGCWIKLMTWVSLIVGATTVQPQLIRPWILYNSFMMAAEIVFWVHEVLSGQIQLELHSILTLVLPCLYILMVKCVQEVFELSVKRGLESLVRVA